MKSELKEIIQSDIYRYYGKKKRTLYEYLLSSLELKYIMLYRKASYTNNGLLKYYYKFRLMRLSRKTQLQIPASTNIGKGLYIGHLGRVIINPSAKLGNNVNLAPGVTIGQESRGKRIGTPTVGNHVWIGTNAVVVGNITIGNDVLIAPNSFVNFDVPDHSIVIGNPATIRPTTHATEGYIQNAI